MVTDVRTRVGRFFLSFGFPLHMNGYHYAKEGIVYIIQNRCIDCNKVLYAYVADEFKTEVINVERCIRTFITKNWDILKETGLFSVRPSSREFILKCAEYISLGFTSASAYDILSQ